MPREDIVKNQKIIELLNSAVVSFQVLFKSFVFPSLNLLSDFSLGLMDRDHLKQY